MLKMRNVDRDFKWFVEIYKVNDRYRGDLVYLNLNLMFFIRNKILFRIFDYSF